MYYSSWLDSGKTMPEIRKKVMKSIRESTYYGTRAVKIYNNPKMLASQYEESVVEIGSNKFVWLKGGKVSQAKIIESTGKVNKSLNADEHNKLIAALDRVR